MLAMDQIHDIRNDYYVQGLNISEIANKRNQAWRTVQKYIDMTDFNDPDPMPKEKALCPKLEPYKVKIDDWLVADKAEPRKQRHTAARVYNRLKEEVPGFNCSVRTVSAYVSARKKNLVGVRSKTWCCISGTDSIFCIGSCGCCPPGT